MKKLILYLGILLTVSSCGPFIFFEQPQPASSEMENIFPKALQGIYNDDANNVPLIINELTCEYGNDTFDMWKEKGQLSDSLILKKNKSYYFLNLLEERGWYVMVISIQNFDKLEIYFIGGDDEAVAVEEIEKLKNLTKVNEIFNSSGGIDHYLINPTQKELKKMLKKNMFSGKMTFTRVNE
jgi:hypothetical protein